MSEIDQIVENVGKINLYPQVVIDSIMECDASEETLQALSDADSRAAMVSGAGTLIVAVNLAQTLAITPDDFDILIDRLHVQAEDVRVKKVQSSLFEKLSHIAESEHISKGILPSVLARRLRKIEEVIH